MFIAKVMEKYANLATLYNLTTLLSEGFEIVPIRFAMSENILVDIKIRFLSQLDDKFWRKNEKMIIFGVFF